MDTAPTTDDLLRIAARHAPMAFDAIKDHPHGVVLDQSPEYVQPGDPDSPHRFTLMPDDVAGEIAEVLLQAPPAPFRYRLAVRRLRDVMNSAYKDLPPIKQRLPYNSAFMNPADLEAEHLCSGARILIESEHGCIEARAAADPELRPGVISISHGFGTLPSAEETGYQGASTNRLISSTRHRQSINAMPRMSGIPVNISRID